MSGYNLSYAARQQAEVWTRSRALERKATWTLDGGRPGGSDGNNFTTNQVTVANYDDARMGSSGSALAHAATWSCVNLYAGTIASLTPSIYRTGPDGTRSEARDHPLFWLLRLDPNFDQSGYEFWEYAGAALELHGNFYAVLTRRPDGTIIAMEPVPPDAMTVRRGRGGGIEYSWTLDGVAKTGTQDDVLHIRGFGGSPLGGVSTLTACSATFAGAVQADSAARGIFANGVQASGVLSSEQRLTGPQRDELETLLRAKFVGAANSGRPMLLDGGLKWVPLSINPVDAQMLESRKYSGEEICRLFGVPPAMVGYGDKSSNWGTGKEADVLGYIKFSLRKRLKRIEQALMKQLLTRAERQGGMFIEFNLEGLLRGDSAARSAFYQIMVRLGVMTRNEARRLENLAPIEGGDVAMVQMQDVPLADAISGQSGGDNSGGGSQ